MRRRTCRSLPGSFAAGENEGGTGPFRRCFRVAISGRRPPGRTGRKERMKRLKNQIRRARHLFRAVAGRALYIAVQVRCPTACFGNHRAEWCVCPAGLSEASIVYSCGVGTDISFDLELIRRFGLKVHGFDPAPSAMPGFGRRACRRNLFSTILALAVTMVKRSSARPNPNHVSYSLLSRGKGGPCAVEAPVRRLATILENLGHQKIDVLKMDIEGAEYEVVRELVACEKPVNQLLVEFHHGWPEVGIDKTKEVVALLNRRIQNFDISPSGVEFTFANRSHVLAVDAAAR